MRDEIISDLLEGNAIAVGVQVRVLIEVELAAVRPAQRRQQVVTAQGGCGAEARQPILWTVGAQETTISSNAQRLVEPVVTLLHLHVGRKDVNDQLGAELSRHPRDLRQVSLVGVPRLGALW